LITTAIDTATKDGQGRMVAFAHYVSAVLHNGLGRHAEALDCARRVIEWDALATRRWRRANSLKQRPAKATLLCWPICPTGFGRGPPQRPPNGHSVWQHASRRSALVEPLLRLIIEIRSNTWVRRPYG
jgi:hypothetical protein